MGDDEVVKFLLNGCVPQYCGNCGRIKGEHPIRRGCKAYVKEDPCQKEKRS